MREGDRLVNTGDELGWTELTGLCAQERGLDLNYSLSSCCSRQPCFMGCAPAAGPLRLVTVTVTWPRMQSHLQGVSETHLTPCLLYWDSEPSTCFVKRETSKHAQQPTGHPIVSTPRLTCRTLTQAVSVCCLVQGVHRSRRHPQQQQQEA